MATRPDVVVYRRDGCPFCLRLETVLKLARVRYVSRDIWTDEDARAFVRSVNDGNETVPTVVIGDEVMTNPGPVARGPHGPAHAELTARSGGASAGCARRLTRAHRPVAADSATASHTRTASCPSSKVG